MFTMLHSFPAEFNENIIAFELKMSGDFIIVGSLIRGGKVPGFTDNSETSLKL